MAINEQYPQSQLDRVIDGLLHLLPATVSIKISDLRGGKLSWEFVRTPAVSSLPNGNPPAY